MRRREWGDQGETDSVTVTGRRWAHEIQRPSAPHYKHYISPGNITMCSEECSTGSEGGRDIE